jgi:hypothetical protein
VRGNDEVSPIAHDHDDRAGNGLGECFDQSLVTDVPAPRWSDEHVSAG